MRLENLLETNKDKLNLDKALIKSLAIKLRSKKSLADVAVKLAAVKINGVETVGDVFQKTERIKDLNNVDSFIITLHFLISNGLYSMVSQLLRQLDDQLNNEE